MDNALPMVAPLLQRRYNDAMRKRLDDLADAFPELAKMRWPKRRSSKRKPIPGVLALADDGEG